MIHIDFSKVEIQVRYWNNLFGDFISSDAFIEKLYNDLTGKKSGEFIKHN